MTEDHRDDGGDLSPAERTEALFQAAEFWWQRYDRRVQVVWKVHLSFWTALAALIGIVITGRIPSETSIVTLGCAAFAVIVLSLHIYYILSQARMNKLDRDKFDTYYKEFQKLVNVSYDPGLETRARGAKKKSTSLFQYANLFACSVTLIISIALVLASLVSQNTGKVNTVDQSRDPSSKTAPVQNTEKNPYLKAAEVDSGK